MLNDTILLGNLSAKQILYDFGKTRGSVNSSKYNIDTFTLQNIQDVSDKKLAVKDAYYTVLNAIALIDVQKENVKLNMAQLYRSKRYFEAGIRTKIDVSDAKVTLIQAKIALKHAEYNLKLAYANLDEIVGFSTLEQEYSVETKALELEKLYDSLELYELNLKESILYAYKNRAIIQKQSKQIKSSEAKITESRSEYYPSLYANAAYTKQSFDNFGAFTPKDQWQANLNLDWNLYQGGATTAKEQESKINKSIETASLVALKLKIKKETTQAFINVYKSKDSVELSQSLVAVSKEKFDQASKRYEHGLSDYIELQQARQGYIDAKATLIIDYYSYYTAVATLDNAIGK
jgi:outer membrane protein